MLGFRARIKTRIGTEANVADCSTILCLGGGAAAEDPSLHPLMGKGVSVSRSQAWLMGACRQLRGSRRREAGSDNHTEGSEMYLSKI